MTATKGARMPGPAEDTTPRASVAVALAILFGATGLGSAAVALALPDLIDDLEVSAGQAALVVSGYSLALAVGCTVLGRLGDRIGIRTPLVAGVAVMITAACVAALVDSLPALVAARAAQGLGAAAVPALTLAAIQAIFDGDARARAMATYAAVGATVNVLGPVIGAALVGPLGWRPVVALPVATALILPFLWNHLPTTRQPGRTMDLLGALLVSLAASGAILSLQGAVLGARVAIAGAVLLVVAVPLVLLRVRRRPDGVVHAALIGDRVALVSLLTAVSMPAAWFGLLVTLSTALVAAGWSTIQVGMLLVPCALLGLFVPRVTGPLLIRLGPRRSQLAATAGTVVALALAAAGVHWTAAVPLVLASLVLMVSFTLGQPAMTMSVADAVPPSTRGGALGLLTLFFLLGGALGAATAGGLGEAIGPAAALLALGTIPAGAALALLIVGRGAGPRGRARADATDLPTTDAPTTGVSPVDVPTTDVPSADVSTADVPTTEETLPHRRSRR